MKNTTCLTPRKRSQRSPGSVDQRVAFGTGASKSAAIVGGISAIEYLPYHGFKKPSHRCCFRMAVSNSWSNMSLLLFFAIGLRGSSAHDVRQLPVEIVLVIDACVADELIDRSDPILHRAQAAAGDRLLDLAHDYTDVDHRISAPVEVRELRRQFLRDLEAVVLLDQRLIRPAKILLAAGLIA